MILKDLLKKYEFADIVPDLLLTDEPVKDNLYAFKETFDDLRRMTPGDAHGEQIIVSVQVDTDDEGNETVCYLHASHCEGDYWENSLAKEVVLESEVSETRALAKILWHMTFHGFSLEERQRRYSIRQNKYAEKAESLEHRQFCNYARINPKKDSGVYGIRCALPLEQWDIYNKREEHRNRAKRMRDARQNRSIARLTRMGKVQHLIDRVLTSCGIANENNLKYLFDTNKICEYDLFSREDDNKGRVDYIIDNMEKYFNKDLLTEYKRFTVLIDSPSGNPLPSKEGLQLMQYFGSLITHTDAPFNVFFGKNNNPSHDIHLLIICCK